MKLKLVAQDNVDSLKGSTRNKRLLELWFYFSPKLIGQELDFPLSHSLVPTCNSIELTLWKIFIRPFYVKRPGIHNSC